MKFRSFRRSPPAARFTGAPPGPNQQYIAFEKVSLSFGETRVLDNISFEVREGEFLCLLGPSGCGKSTTLRLLSGLLNPTAGSIRIGAQTPLDASEEFAFVFQNPRLANWRSALDNVTLSTELRVGRGDRADWQRRAIELLTLVGLPNDTHKRPLQMSGGERQRVAIARALHVRPRALLMDEPFSALDVSTRKTMQDELIALWQRQLSTVIFVTHDIDEAIVLAQRILVFSCKPARIIDIVELKQARPRRPESDGSLAAVRARLYDLLGS